MFLNWHQLTIPGLNKDRDFNLFAQSGDSTVLLTKINRLYIHSGYKNMVIKSIIKFLFLGVCLGSGHVLAQTLTLPANLINFNSQEGEKLLIERGASQFCKKRVKRPVSI